MTDELDPHGLLERLRELVPEIATTERVREAGELIDRVSTWLTQHGYPPLDVQVDTIAADAVCAPCSAEAGEPVSDSHAHRRIWHESGVPAGSVSVADPVAHSPEALELLRTHGVDAFHTFLATQE